MELWTRTESSKMNSDCQKFNIEILLTFQKMLYYEYMPNKSQTFSILVEIP